MDIKAQLKDKSKWLFICVFSGLIDFAFLVNWLVIQYWYQLIKLRFPLNSCNERFLLIFDIIFYLATLIPALIFIVFDIAALIKESCKKYKSAN